MDLRRPDRSRYLELRSPHPDAKLAREAADASARKRKAADGGEAGADADADAAAPVPEEAVMGDAPSAPAPHVGGGEEVNPNLSIGGCCSDSVSVELSMGGDYYHASCGDADLDLHAPEGPKAPYVGDKVRRLHLSSAPNPRAPAASPHPLARLLRPKPSRARLLRSTRPLRRRLLLLPTPRRRLRLPPETLANRRHGRGRPPPPRAPRPRRSSPRARSPTPRPRSPSRPPCPSPPTSSTRHPATSPPPLPSSSTANTRSPAELPITKYKAAARVLCLGSRGDFLLGGLHPAINWAEKESHVDADEMAKLLDLQ